MLRPAGRVLLHELDPLGGHLAAVDTAHPRITALVLRRLVLPGSPPSAALRAAALAAGLAVADEGPIDGLPFNALEVVRR